MNYAFKNFDGTLKDKVVDWRLNGDISKLDIMTSVNYNQETLLEFKSKISNLKGKKVLLIGDYDCDGITATYIMRKLLLKLDISVNYYIPSRFKDGYGINEAMVDMAYDNHFDVIITLDNGIVAYKPIDKALALGIDVLIVDHHEYECLPKVSAILHGSLLEEGYKNLCTAGLACLLYHSFFEDDKVLAYASIATLADMVEVFGYNRYLLKKGLNILNTQEIYTINALSLKSHNYSYDDLSYHVIPKINAVSRLNGNANKVVAYLDMDQEEASKMALEINNINNKRKDIGQMMKEKAMAYHIGHNVLVSYDTSYEEGLCGLIAGQMMNQEALPSLVFALKDGLLKGSGRAPEGINLYDILKPYKSHFKSFGGHEAAVGLSLTIDEIDGLLEYLETIELNNVNKEVLVVNSDDLQYEDYLKLKELEPFGTGFKEPLFALMNPDIKSFFKIKGKYPKYVLNNNL